MFLGCNPLIQSLCGLISIYCWVGHVAVVVLLFLDILSVLLHQGMHSAVIGSIWAVVLSTLNTAGLQQKKTTSEPVATQSTLPNRAMEPVRNIYAV